MIVRLRKMLISNIRDANLDPDVKSAVNLYQPRLTTKKAMKFTGTAHSVKVAIGWLNRPEKKACLEVNYENKKEELFSLIIGTLEGPHKCSPGDYIIEGLRGEYYPCKPDIFKKSYISVAEAKKRDWEEKTKEIKEYIKKGGK